MIKSIGKTAGDVWKFLNKNGPTSFNRLCAEIDSKEKIIAMAVGWLARENKIIFSKKGRFDLIGLK